MRRTLTIVLAVRHALMVVLLAMVVATTATAKEKQLVILHTNDTHSCIYPINPIMDDTLTAGRGGFLRRLQLLKEQRQQHPDLLLFDSGDFSQGSTYYTMFQGDVEAGLMNMMGYAAGTIGNHEFDFGMDNMARLFRMLNFPIVCANYDFTNTPVEGLVKPYVVLQHKGLRIGVFGLSPKLSDLVFQKNCEGVVYSDPIEAANRVAALLKDEEHCDLVICLSHLGWELGCDDDQELMAKTRNIDLVLGGHSHTYFTQLRHVNNLDNKAVPNDQNGKHGIYIGKLTLTMGKAKRCKTKSAE